MSLEQIKGKEMFRQAAARSPWLTSASQAYPMLPTALTT